MNELKGIAPTKSEPSAIAKMSNIFFGDEDEAVDGVLPESDQNSFDQNGFEKDHILEEQTVKRNLFRLKVSSSSCAISDIKGFVYGGLTSRFWMLRKHINTMEHEELKKPGLPFYTWECITLQLSDRDVCIVIRNEKLMAGFLKLLTYFLKSVDGDKDSAVGLKDALVRKMEREYLK